MALAAALVATNAASAQTPKPKPKPSKPATTQGSAASQPKIKLLLTPDAPCTVTVNGESIGRIEADEVRAVVGTVGDNIIQAKSTEESDARWSITQKVAPSEVQVAVRIPMRETIDAPKRARAAAAEQARKDAVAAQAAHEAAEIKRRGWVQVDALQWALRDNGQSVDWRAAKQYCDDLTLDGHGDWRLPTIEELSRMFDASSDEYYKIRGGIHVTGPEWSSTAMDSEECWFFYFHEGMRASTFRDLDAYALCVRLP